VGVLVVIGESDWCQLDYQFDHDLMAWPASRRAELGVAVSAVADLMIGQAAFHGGRGGRFRERPKSTPLIK
jgi:hypothetical protein